MPNFSHLNGLVSALVAEAAQTYIVPLFRHLSREQITLKAPQDYVTQADRDVEAFLLPRLLELLPGSVTVGEESTHDNPAILGRLDQSLVWLVDPLDGTRNFVEGRPDFAVMVCLLADGVSEMAWIFFPMLGKQITVERGRGVAINGQPVALAAAKGDEAPTGILVHSGMPPAVSQRLAARAGELGHAGPELFSAAADCLALLEGQLDFVLYWKTLPWDHAPCCLAIVEAGGACQRPDGKDYVPGDDRSGLVVTRSPELTQRATRWMRTELA